MTDDEYPQVTSTRLDSSSWAVTIRRNPHLITKLHVKDDEVEPLIGHLQGLNEPDDD